MVGDAGIDLYYNMWDMREELLDRPDSLRKARYQTQRTQV